MLDKTVIYNIPEMRLSMLKRVLIGEQIAPHNLTKLEWRYLEDNGFCQLCKKACNINHDKGF